MSVVTNYIDVNSSNRDRTRYSSPFDFEVSMENISSTPMLANDPVSLAAPSYRMWTSLNRLDPPSNSVTGTLFQIIGNIIFCTFADSTDLINKNIDMGDFYTGLTLVATNGVVTASRTIEASAYLNTTGLGITKMIIILEKPLPDSLAVTDPVSVTLSTTPTNSSPHATMFIPKSKFVRSAYEGMYLTLVAVLPDDLIQESLQIIGYDAHTHTVVLDGVFTAGIFDTAGNEILIRNSAPDIIGVVDRLNSSTSTLRLTAIDRLAIPGSFIRVTLVDSTPTPPDLATSVILRITSSSIVSGVTEVGISPLLSGPISGLTYNPRYEILTFAYDNANPISFTGSKVLLSTEACYEIKLLHLILPTFGGLFSNIPFLWVQLSSVTNVGGVRDVIWSNALNTGNYLFKVPIKDLKHPDVSTFVKFDGANMTDFIPFKPLDTFRFAVYFPDGTTPEAPDIPNVSISGQSPAIPDIDLNVSATFEIRRRS